MLSKSILALLVAASIVMPASASTYVFRAPAPGVVALSPASLGGLTPSNAFTNVELNSTATAVISLTNSNKLPLAIKAISARGTSAVAEFSATHTCGSTLAGNSSCDITVRFSPAELGARQGVLSVSAGEGVQAQTTMALSGTAIVPPIAIVTGGKWSDGTYAKTCLGYLQGDATHTPSTTNGVYIIKPGATTYSVTCDMSGGGWTRFDYMVAGVIAFPGHGRSVTTPRVSSQYLAMYQEIAGQSSQQKILGLYGNSESGFDRYQFQDWNYAMLPNTQAYSGTQSSFNTTLTINKDWRKTLGYTYFITDGSVDNGGGAGIPAQTWFR